jgi:class 3 adenylate cyclase/tetratricopeptide (TPR) repeat protein/ribosomal protein L40E
MRCSVCGAENAPGAKFCNQCGSPLLSISCPVCSATNAPTAKFCNECGSPLPALQPQSTPLPGTNTSVELPPLASLEAEERRIVTILFADMTGSTALADELDPEDVRLLMAGYFGVMAQAIHRHGGTIEKFIGDAVMAVFGIPVTHEDDPDRAVRAALEILYALQGFNNQRVAEEPEAQPIQVRIGINTGEVVAASEAGEGGQFLITGDAVNVAARLQQHAQPGTILVGSRTYRSTRGAIVYQPVSAFTVKGKPAPLRAWQALRSVEGQAAPPTQHLRGIEGLPAPFIGRAPELALLDALYERVIGERRPHLITLLGAPGVGKSRLIREWMRQLRQQPSVQDGLQRAGNPLFAQPLVLEGRCPPYGAGITYWPLAEILRTYSGMSEGESAQAARERLFQRLRELVEGDQAVDDLHWLARQLAFTVGLEGGEDVSLATRNSKEYRETLFRAWRIFFEALARRQPLLLFIDDIHWADEALLDLLEYLTQRVNDAPLLLLCPARPDLLEKRSDWGGGKRNFTLLTLEPLSSDQSYQMLDALLSPDGLPASLRNSILAKAEGNPFFVEEIVRMLIDRGILVCNGQRWQTVDQDPGQTYADLLSFSLPDTIQGVLAARIDLLSIPEKRVLQHAAVAGRTFWKGALTHLAQEMTPAPIDQALSQLLRKDFLIENERPTGMLIEHDVQYSFKHVLVRDVAYASMSRARRAREHARMAEWLERIATGRLEEFTELLAYQYHQAIVAFSQTTSGQALLHRPARAQAQADLRQKATRYLIQAGDEALGKYSANQAARHYTAALDLLNGSESDLTLRSRLHEKLARAYFVLSDGDSSWEQYQQALSKSQTTSAQQRAHLYQHLTMLGTRWRAWFKRPPDLQMVRTYLDEGLALLKDQPETPELALLLASEAFWYLSAYFSQRLDETAIQHAIASAEQAASLGERLSNPMYHSEVLDALSSVYGNVSDYRAFLEVQKRRLALAERIRDRAEVYDIYYTASRAYYQLSEYSQALHWANEALKVAESMNSRRKLCAMLGQKTLIYFQWDRWPDVLQWGEKLAILCEQYDLLSQSWPAPSGIAALAAIYYRTGQDERGDYYATMVEQAVSGPNPRYELIIGHLRMEQGRLEEAREIFQRIANQYPAFEQAYIRAKLVELAALLGDESRYDELGPTTLTLMERTGSRKDWAGQIRARGMMHSRRGESPEATNDLNTALECYQNLGTRWEEALTLEALAVHLSNATTQEEQKESVSSLLESAVVIYQDFHAEQALQRIRSLAHFNGGKTVRNASTHP